MATATADVGAGDAPPVVAPPPAPAVLPGSGGVQALRSIVLTADAPAVTINLRRENCYENFVIA
ncbi:MAG: hypothetical protein WBA89_05055 [Microcoleus sp.]